MKLEIREIGIPPRPAILIQIEEESAKDEPDFIYMAKLLNRDVALAAGMIKVANAPYFSFGKKVPTVQEALLVLGLKLVTKTVSGLALQQVFKQIGRAHGPFLGYIGNDRRCIGLRGQATRP